MTNIILTISYGSHSECLTITQKTTWSDLCASIWDSSRLSVTQLYYRDREGDIIAFASDGELASLKQDCTTGWLHVSIDPTNTARWVFDDSFVNQHGDPAMPARTNTATSFTSQFEQFGKLMDKYNNLIQRNEQVKAIMHQTATEITLQQSPVNLADLEIRLKNYQSQSLYPQYAKLPSTNLSRSATTATPRRMMKRTPSASLYHDDNDQPCSTGYPDVPPPSYESQQPDENDNRKSDRRRHTTHYFENHSFPSSSWGEWPAYSSLHPPPQTIPSPQPTAPKLDVPPPISAPSSPPNLIQHHQPHAQRPPMSLYPRPPILPALLKRTSRLLQNWVPPLTTPSHPHHPPLDSFSRKVGSSCSNNDNGAKALCNDFVGGSCKRKQKGKQHANENRHTHHGLLEAIQDRHMYKEQQRALRQQQKELARTRRHLKQQEKRPQPITIRKSSSLSSISSLSSQSTCSSLSSSSPSHTLDQPLQYPSIPAPPIQHRRSTPPANHDHYGPRDNADDQSLDEKLDRQDMEYLTHAFNQFSATNDGAKKEMIG